MDDEEYNVRACPFCKEEIHSLSFQYPIETGSIDLDVPYDEEAIINMDLEIRRAIVYCPECGENIPDDVLKAWNVRLEDK